MLYDEPTGTPLPIQANWPSYSSWWNRTSTSAWSGTRTSTTTKWRPTCTNCWGPSSTSTAREFSIEISSLKTSSSPARASNLQISAPAKVPSPSLRHLLKAALHGVYLHPLVQGPRVPHDRRLLWLQDGHLGLRLCPLLNDCQVPALQRKGRTRPDPQN